MAIETTLPSDRVGVRLAGMMPPMSPRLTLPEDGLPVTVLCSASTPFPQHGILGIVRSLGRAGVSVVLASPEPSRGVPGASRYVRAHEPWDLDEGVERLESIARRRGRSILLATDDLTSVMVQDHADRLRQEFVFPVAPHGLAARLLDKAVLAGLALDAGVATPMTAMVSTAAAADAFTLESGFPVVAKGLPGHRAGRRSVTVVHGREGLVRLLEEAAPAGLVLQEHVPGSPREVNWIFDGYFDTSGRCRFWATGRKLAQYPVYAGTATHAVTERNEVIGSLVIGFLEGLGYVGPVDVDLRFDARDDRYLLLDVNPRVGGTFRTFVSAGGLDVVRAAYLDLSGFDVPMDPVPDGRAWVWETHVAACVVPYRRDGWLSVRSWLRSLRGVDEGAFVGLDDFRPALRAARFAAARLLPTRGGASRARGE